MKLKIECPKCGSKKLRYFERHEVKYSIDPDGFVQKMDSYALTDEVGGGHFEIECADCNLSSDESKELLALMDQLRF